MMHLPLAKINGQLETYPLWKESVDYLELEKKTANSSQSIEKL
jgi:hypothetical protein